MQHYAAFHQRLHCCTVYTLTNSEDPDEMQHNSSGSTLKWLKSYPEKYNSFLLIYNPGAQWLSGRVLDSRPKGQRLSLTGVTALWSLSKTHLS